MKDLKSLDIKALTESEQINLKGGCNRSRPKPPTPPVLPPSAAAG